MAYHNPEIPGSSFETEEEANAATKAKKPEDKKK